MAALTIAERLRWQDRLLLDKSKTHFTVRVALLIGRALNNESGQAAISADRLASHLGCTNRGVQKAIALLAAQPNPYIKVERREIGVDRHGRKIYGAEGGSNIYSIIVPESTNRGASSGSTETSNARSGSERQRTNPRSAEHERQFNPNKESPIYYPKSRVRAPGGARPAIAGGKREPPQLGAEGERLRGLIGDAAYVSWFSEAWVENRDNESLRISVASKFIANELRQKFADKLRLAYAVKHVEIVIRSATTLRPKYTS